MTAAAPLSVTYRRTGFTWAAFGCLAAFGLLNAVLGPALPYLREVEGIGYLAAAAHQVAFAVGGGLAGLLAAGARRDAGRGAVIRAGLAGAGVASLGIAYGNRFAVTVVAALLVSLLGTSALVRLWAALADAHGPVRTVAMTEGEVAVSLGAIVAPLLIGGLAGTALGWRSAFAAGALLVLTAVVASVRAAVPPTVPADGAPDGARPGAGWRAPTLLVVLTIVALEFALNFWLATYLHDDVGVAVGPAAAMVGVLYAANLVGRLVTSRLARRATAERLLVAAIVTALVGMPLLLTATNIVVAAAGLAITSTGTGAMFPLVSSLHVAATRRSADAAVGEVLAVAALGQILGPVAVAALAQVAGLRLGLVLLPVFALLAAAGLRLHHRRAAVALA